jgi:hypothetical protein
MAALRREESKSQEKRQTAAQAGETRKLSRAGVIKLKLPGGCIWTSVRRILEARL